ncbi:Hint domain-containing protein [Albirhodobacter sp. R86504]|uniref:Hint domain-containing protein n=1 Tax=Albirhodobacter sp. R86504 TaxID=3093848 RepID=UPI00366E421D
MAKTSTGPTDRQDLHEPTLASMLLHASPTFCTDAAPISAAPLMPATVGIALGAHIMTLDGEIPVEFLAQGDRVITRSGARLLRNLIATELSGEMICVHRGALGHNRPEHALLLLPASLVHLRDWRAQAFAKQDQALSPADRLTDGEFITRESVSHQRVFTLEFDCAEIIFANGVEIGCDAVQLRADDTRGR